METLRVTTVVGTRPEIIRLSRIIARLDREECIHHTLIHTGANVVIRRFQVFVFGFSVVALMWVWFGLRLYVIG